MDEDEDLDVWREWDARQEQYDMPVEDWMAASFPDTVPRGIYSESYERVFSAPNECDSRYHLIDRADVQQAFERACTFVDNSLLNQFTPTPRSAYLFGKHDQARWRKEQYGKQKAVPLHRR